MLYITATSYENVEGKLVTTEISCLPFSFLHCLRFFLWSESASMFLAIVNVPVVFLFLLGLHCEL